MEIIEKRDDGVTVSLTNAEARDIVKCVSLTEDEWGGYGLESVILAAMTLKNAVGADDNFNYSRDVYLEVVRKAKSK